MILNIRVLKHQDNIVHLEQLGRLCNDANLYAGEDCTYSRGRTYQDYITNCGHKFTDEDDITHCPLCGGLLTYESNMPV